jgi:serine/threonine-protein kinase HipA
MEYLNVFHANCIVGRLGKNPDGLLFTYSDQWLASPNSFAISVSLPLQEDPLSADAFFGNLLPEGRLREYLCKAVFRLDYGDDFGLLKAIGGDCAGALSIIPQYRDIQSSPDPSYHLLSESNLEELLDMPFPTHMPFLNGHEEVRLSLAGAQDKLVVGEFSGTMYLPVNGAASTHIIKPQSAYLDFMVENEFFCMSLGRKMSLNIPPCEIIQIQDDIAYKIERYDRHILTPFKVSRVHQEDFCQALGVKHANKYQENGGPTIKECFDLLGAHSATPAKDRKSLLDLIVFNYLVGNTDCHGKNLSLIYDSKGSKTLSPAYDIVSGIAYNKFFDMAMHIGGVANSQHVEIENWKRLSKDIGVKSKVVIETLERQADTIREKALENAQEMSSREDVGLDVQFVDNLADLVISRAEKTLRQLNIDFFPMDPGSEDDLHAPR